MKEVLVAPAAGLLVILSLSTTVFPVPFTDAQGIQERALADTMAENALLRG
jgi:hypothetical protein